MKAKRRTEITMETHETTIIRFRQSQTTTYCESCRTNAPHLSIVQAGSVLSLSESEISSLVVERKIHATPAADGKLMLCVNSLVVFEKKTETNE